MSSERNKATRGARSESSRSDALDEQQRGTLANPEPTSGVVERSTGLRAREGEGDTLEDDDRNTQPEAQALNWDQRDTPEFDLWADRTAAVSLLSPEEADRHAERIRPAWEDPGWVLKPGALRAPTGSAPRELAAGAHARAAAEFARALPPEEADYYAARIRPAWQSARPAPKGLLGSEAAFEAELRDAEFAPPPSAWPEPGASDPDAARWHRRVRARQVRGWLIAGAAIASFAAFGVLALSAPPTRTSEPPATGRSGLSAASITQDAPNRLQGARPPSAEAPAAKSDALDRMPDVVTPPADLAPSPAPAAQTAQPAEPDLGPSVRVRINAEPPRARIRLDGVRVSNPFDTRIPATRHRVVIEARGYLSRDLTLSGEHDERIRVTLVKR